MFIDDAAENFPSLRIAYAGGDPRIKFFADERQRDLSIVDGTRQSEEQLLRILEQGPDALKVNETPLVVDISKLTLTEIEEVLIQHGVTRVTLGEDLRQPPKSEL